MRAIGAGTRVFEVLDRQPLIPLQSGIELSPERRGMIRFEHVHFEYPTRKDIKVLKDFHLEVKVGETVAIVWVAKMLFADIIFDACLSGQSGGGKSSVHSLLLRYYDPTHGKVTFDGQGKRIL
jgi:ABC-type multidrug transport system fused ATPase/permease subunit